MACCIFLKIVLKVIPTKRRLKNLGSVYWEEFSWAEPIYQATSWPSIIPALRCHQVWM